MVRAWSVAGKAALAAVVLFGLLAVPAGAERMEEYVYKNINGYDYNHWDLSPFAPGSQESCRDACLNDPQCDAATYQMPEFTGRGVADCWVKHGTFTAADLVDQAYTIIWLKVERTDAAPATTGSLSISSVPSGGSVFVDGLSRGSTPMTVSGLTPGSHTVEVTKSGYNDYTGTWTVSAGSVTPVTITLSQEAASTTGTLTITSIPSGAAVMVDGLSRGVTPRTISGLTPGSHPVKVTLAGYDEYSTTATVVAGGETKVAATLTAAGGTSAGSGSIDVRSQPSGATISLDGSQKGVTPSKLTNVRAGVHEVKLTLTGYSDWKQSVAVEAGKTASVNAQLSSSTAGTGQKSDSSGQQAAASGTGTLSVTTTPAGAQVYIDGNFVGNTPITTSGLSAGSHRLRLAMSGYSDVAVPVTITAGETAQYSTSMVEGSSAAGEGMASSLGIPGFSAFLGILALVAAVAAQGLFRRTPRTGRK